MQIEYTPIEGCFIIHDTFFGDSRGYFFESFNRNTFLEKTGVAIDFVQDNQSSSSKGVLRGLHYQNGEFAQAKLVRVLSGAVLDVAVELTGESRTQFFVPRGFAHGFVVLSEQATFFYKVDNYYHKASEGGIIYNDSDLAIDWKLPENEIKLSDKDLILPLLRDTVNTLQF